MKTEINDKAHELGLIYFPNEQNIWARENIEAIYCSGACIAMAEWMQKKMIDKVCEWLQNQDMSKYISVLCTGACVVSFTNDELIEMFRKAMEE